MHVVLFYETASGNPVVRDFLRAFDRPDRAILGEDLKTVQIGFPMGLPLCRPLGQGLWEVRSSLTGNREARLIFYHDSHARALVVLHGFLKKTQKTPKAEIATALKRKREFSP
ncbi:MAG TPA: type II toxin-antitoxin system RelE/ParE family toxin [Caulobacteraceae bacterium]